MVCGVSVWVYGCGCGEKDDQVKGTKKGDRIPRCQ